MSPRRVNRKIAWTLGGGGRRRVACDTQNMRGAPQPRDGQDHGHPRTAGGHHSCPVANRRGLSGGSGSRRDLWLQACRLDGLQEGGMALSRRLYDLVSRFKNVAGPGEPRARSDPSRVSLRYQHRPPPGGTDGPGAADSGRRTAGGGDTCLSAAGRVLELTLLSLWTGRRTVLGSAVFSDP